MHIDELLSTQRPVFSVEFFPPKTPTGLELLFETVAALRPLGPDYVSVTYGAGGATRDGTVEIAERMKRDHGLEVMAHLSCVGETRDGLASILDRFAAIGIENVLALRGDPPRGRGRLQPPEDGLSSAAELTGFIADAYDFSIGGACFPEVHPEAPERGRRPRLPEDEGRVRGELPDHPAVLRQPGATSTSWPRRASSGSTCRSSPG